MKVVKHLDIVNGCMRIIICFKRCFLGVVSAKLTVSVSFKTRRTKYYPESTLATAPLVFYSHYTHLRRHDYASWKEIEKEKLVLVCMTMQQYQVPGIVNGQCVSVCVYMSVCR